LKKSFDEAQQACKAFGEKQENCAKSLAKFLQGLVFMSSTFKSADRICALFLCASGDANLRLPHLQAAVRHV
jgi:hypothetical protein